MAGFDHAPVCQAKAAMFVALRDFQFICLKFWIYKDT